MKIRENVCEGYMLVYNISNVWHMCVCGCLDQVSLPCKDIKWMTDWMNELTNAHIASYFIEYILALALYMCACWLL